MQKILMVGGTGMIGKPVTWALINAGFQVTMLARNPQKAQQLFPEATVLPGDVFEPLSLLKAFEGQDAVYISLSPPRTARRKDRLPEREGIENIVAAAQKTGIKRLVLLSSMVQHYNGMNGFHWWVFDVKQAAVEMVRKSGIPYTIFYPSTFMECFDQLLLKGNRIMLAGDSKAPMHFIAADDYAQQVVRSFQQPAAGNKEYPVQGPDPYTWEEGARIFIEHYTKASLKTLKAPLGVFKVMGTLVPLVDYGAKISEALNKYPEQFESSATWAELGKPQVTVAAYADRLSNREEE